MGAACSLQCSVRLLPCTSFCLVLSSVPCAYEGHTGEIMKRADSNHDGFDPEVAGKMLQTKNKRIPFLSSYVMLCRHMDMQAGR